MQSRQRRFPAGAAALVVVAAALVPGCSQGKREGPLYRIEAPVVEVGPGAGAAAKIRFLPAPGFHWNTKFPAAFRVESSGGLKAERERYQASSGDFKVESGQAELEVPVKPAGPGKYVLEGKADFSVCNDKECHIFKGIRVEVPVHVR